MSNNAEVIGAAVEGLDYYLNFPAEFALADEPPLYDDQLAAIYGIRNVLAAEQGTVLEWPTGAGKTRVAAEIIRATGLRTLYCVIQSSVQGQTEEQLKRWGVQSVRQINAYNHESRDAQVSITTYAGLVGRVKRRTRYLLDPSRYQLVVLDDALRSVAVETRSILEEHFGHCLLVGFLATQERQDERAVTDLMPGLAHKLDLGQTTASGANSPLSNVVLHLGADLSRVDVNPDGDYRRRSLVRVINTDERNHAIARFHAACFAGERALFNCAAIAHADDLAASLVAKGVSAVAYHTNMTPKTAAQILADHRSGVFSAIVQVGKLIRGYDDPTLTVAYNVSPTVSADYQLQRDGRVLRPDPANDAKHAIVIDCIDAIYRVFPLLYCHPRVAGVAEILGGRPMHPAARSLLGRLASYRSQGVWVETDPLKVEAIARQHRMPTPRPPALSEQTIKDKVEEMLGAVETGWADEALCVDMPTELFSPGKGESHLPGYSACRRCQVQDSCLASALISGDISGIRAGVAGGRLAQVLRSLRKGQSTAEVTDDLRARQARNFERARRSLQAR